MRYYNKCMGHCCTEIALPLSPNELRESYEMFLRRDQQQVSMAKDAVTTPTYQDVHLIYPMLKYLKEKNGHPENRRSKNRLHWYSCKHFDHKKKECSIYEIRPKMCRTYPDSDTCKNPSCQWKGKAQSWHDREKMNNKNYKGETKCKQ